MNEYDIKQLFQEAVKLIEDNYKDEFFYDKFGKNFNMMLEEIFILGFQNGITEAYKKILKNNSEDIDGDNNN